MKTGTKMTTRDVYWNSGLLIFIVTKRELVPHPPPPVVWLTEIAMGMTSILVMFSERQVAITTFAWPQEILLEES